jgi:nucleotide sugar dehydrogenase
MKNTVSRAFPNTSTVAVVGLGKIGLPLAIQYVRHGWRVVGCDVNANVVATINAGISHVQEEPELMAVVADAVEEGRLMATVDTASAVRQAQVVVVIVPVAVDAQHRVDFRAIDAATNSIGRGLRAGTLVVYETTLPVGTTARRFAPMLEEASSLVAGQDFHLAYSPERVSSGSIFRDLATYPKVVGGVNEESLAAAVAFYRSVLDTPIITMASTDEAEFVKLIETTYRDVNIALANEFACFADTHGLDVAAAIQAANTQPYSHIHTPGVGVGGHCIPVYPYFLLAGAEEAEMPGEPGKRAIMPPLQLPRHARKINDSMADYAVQRIEAVTGSLVGRGVLILGAAYRGDVREVAFTSARLLQDALIRRGAIAYVDDPLFSDDELLSMGYTPLCAGDEDAICAIVLQANHKVYQDFDFRRFPHCRVLLDGRRVLEAAKVEAAGIRYLAIGDSGRQSWEEQQEPSAQLVPVRNFM